MEVYENIDGYEIHIVDAWCTVVKDEEIVFCGAVERDYTAEEVLINWVKDK